MRKALLFSAFSFLTLLLYAQPVLDQTAVGAIGSIYYLGSQDSFPSGFALGSAGANQIWDYSMLEVHSMDTVSFLSPSSSSYAADFPTSNLAIQQSSLNGGIAFLESSTSGLDILGLAADLLGTGSPIVVRQNPPSRLAQFPFTYQNTFSNLTVIDVTVDASGFGIPFVDSARYKNIQDRDLMADGYGTLNLPSNNYTNVLRVKEINTQTDSIWIRSFLGWSLFQDSVYTDSTFTYWNVSKGYYLAQASYVGGDLSSITYQDPIVVARPEPQANLYKVYPVPAVDQILVETDNRVSKMQITDLQGRILKTETLSGAKTALDVKDWPRGYYFYSLLDKNGVAKQTGKLLLVN